MIRLVLALTVIVKAAWSVRTLHNHDEFGYLFGLKGFENCDVWAAQDGECVNNPRFMWSACVGSCLSTATDTHENCALWAEEGECAANPNYLHTHCPDSCGAAVAWSPWVRRSQRIDDIPLDASLGRDAQAVPRDLAEAAELMRQRVKKYVSGYAAVVEGLASTAPTEFLGMLGLAEALIYTLRLQELVMEYAELHGSIDAHRELIDDVMDTLRRGYEPDPIYRATYRWIEGVDKSAEAIRAGLQYRAAENVNVDISLERLAAQFSKMHTQANVPTIPPAVSEETTVTLSNGIVMPRLGLGTWQLEGEECVAAVRSAIENGYRFFDTAQAYRNEAEVGAAITESIAKGIVKRGDIFIATKISDENFAGYENTMRLVEKQLKDLQTDYIDLYMLHSPIRNRQLQADTWRALEDLYNQKKIRALGVSNFDVSELEELMRVVRVAPMMVQNKVDLYHVGKQMDNRGVNNLRFCLENNMVMLAYSPFSAYPFMMQPLDDPIVRYLVAKRNNEGENISASQLVLKWIAQRGMAMIPRSANPARQGENLAALSIRPLNGVELTLLDLCQVLIGHPYAFAVELPASGMI